MAEGPFRPGLDSAGRTLEAKERPAKADEDGHADLEGGSQGIESIEGDAPHQVSQGTEGIRGDALHQVAKCTSH